MLNKSCRSCHFEFHIGTKNVKFVEDHLMNIHVQFGFNQFVVSEKKAFEHFPIGSNVNLCPAVAAKFSIGIKKQKLYRGPSNDHSWAVPSGFREEAFETFFP